MAIERTAGRHPLQAGDAWKSARRIPRRACILVSIGLALVLASCTAAPSPRTSEPAGQASQPRALKRITLAVTGGEPALYNSIGAGSRDDAVEELTNKGLSDADDRQIWHPVLAEALPRIEDGSWKVLPDGRMETTWKIKPGVQWHDGAPYTADDVVFTLKISMDPELPFTGRAAYRTIEAAEAPDPRTVVVHWKGPFIEADRLFSREMALPLPKHLLENAANEDKAGFESLPFWGEKYVGSGAYKLREYSLGAPVMLEAFDRFVLGRPKIDEIEIKLFSDSGALAASILSGGVDLLLGRGFDFDQVITMETQWKEGKVETRFSGSMTIYAQFLNQNPAVVADVRFRRALLHAIDRQQMVDLLLLGRSSVAPAFLGSNEPEYPDAEAALIRYDYDPRRAAQLLEGLGYTRGPDGALRDAAGQRLVVELRTEPGDTEQKSAFAVADFWQQAGVGVEPVVVPGARLRELEYVNTFPAFFVRGQSSRIPSGFPQYLISSAALPENRFAGRNHGRYVNPELDAAIERYFITIPIRERNQTLQTIMRIITDQVPNLSLFYSPQFTLVARRVQNFIPVKGSGTAGKTWQSHLWDVQ